jgi:hypothetical protein
MPEKENWFEIKVTGSSTIYTEDEIITLIYELLKDKAEFQIQ